MDYSVIEQTLTSILTHVLKLSENDVRELTSFEEMGITSINTVELLEEINQQFNLTLPTNILFECQSVKKLAQFIDKRLQKTPLNQPKLKPTIASNHVHKHKQNHTQNDNQDIAIVGMGSRVPGAENLAALWARLLNGETLPDLPLESRWRDKDASTWGEKLGLDNYHIQHAALIEGVSQFDPLFFNISPKEAKIMDPQLRKALEITQETIEHAGFAGAIKGSHTGVFMGVCNADYWDEALLNGSVVQRYLSSLTGRINYCYDFRGPSLPIDTACSSSLIAIHMACSALRNNECDAAIVLGVNLLLSAVPFAMMASQNILSNKGNISSFDESADGYVRGEGALGLMLMPLARAVRMNATIYAVIKGSTVSHSGRTDSPMMPKASALSFAIKRTLEQAQVKPESIGYIETQGTGIKLGDAIEFDGLLHAFDTKSPKEAKCCLGSIKPNIGHLESASGLAGVIKAVLCMQHQTIPPLVNFKKKSHLIDIENSPFYINTESIDFPCHENNPRRAGVHAFSMHGQNAFVLLEAYAETRSYDHIDGLDNSEPVVILLSAKNTERLKAYIKKLYDWIAQIPEQQKKENPYLLSDIAYTLQVGREAMDTRFAIVVSSLEQLQHGLRDYLGDSGAVNQPYVFFGQLNSSIQHQAHHLLNHLFSEVMIQDALKLKQTDELARFWVEGLPIDWNMFYEEKIVRRIALPTYPFEKKSYWFSDLEKNLENKLENNAKNQTEMTLTHVVSKLLNIPVDELSMDQNLHDYGIDSASATQLIHRVHATFDVELGHRDLLEHTSIRALSEHILMTLA